MKMTTVAEQTGDRAKALLYGKSGTGKTYTAFSLDQKETLILSAESGLLTLAGSTFPVAKIECWDDVNEAYRELLGDAAKKRYRNIFIDSLSELNELCKVHIVQVERPGLKGLDIGKVYAEQMTLQDFGLLATKMIKMVRAFRELPYNVIFTCLEDSEKDETTGIIQVKPSLNGKLAGHVSGYFDFVLRMVAKEEDKKTARYFFTQSTEKVIAKNRGGALDRLEIPSWAVVFEKMAKNSAEMAAKLAKQTKAEAAA